MLKLSPGRKCVLAMRLHGHAGGPIVPVILSGARRAWTVARRLHDSGIYATAVVHPAVQRGSARLRLCAMAMHTPVDYDEVLDALVRAARA